MIVSTRPGGFDQAVRSNSRLVEFLYVLMRDDVTPGQVEALVCQVERGSRETAFCNDFLAAYAIELDRRLAGELSPESALHYAHFELERAQSGACHAQPVPPIPRPLPPDVADDWKRGFDDPIGVEPGKWLWSRWARRRERLKTLRRAVELVYGTNPRVPALHGYSRDVVQELLDIAMDRELRR